MTPSGNPTPDGSPTPSGSAAQSFKTVIAGGGVAGLEAALALRDLAGEVIELTLIAPEKEFVYRPMTVREPFAYAAASRYQLEQIAADLGAKLVADSFAWVDTERRIAYTAEGHPLAYDALVLALGARAHARYEHALTIDDRRLDEQLQGLIQDVEGRYVRSVAFVVPPREGWPLPIYELALMTAARAYDASALLSIAIITPEDAPLGLFGGGAIATVGRLLQDAGIVVYASSYAEIPDSGQLVLNPGDRHLQFDRLVALPELFGPSVRGLRSSEHGFIPVDQHCQVRGVERVYAAGDATDFAVKHGGLATQQADAAAEAIAALADIPIEPHPFEPLIRGMLLTGAAPKYLSAHLTGGHGFSSTITDTPSWSPPTKIAAKYLAPYLERLDRASGTPATAR